MTTPAVLDEPETTTATDALPETASTEPVEAFDDDEDDEGDYAVTVEGDGAEPVTTVEPVEVVPAPVDFQLDVDGKPYAIAGLKMNPATRSITAENDAAFHRLQTLAKHGRAFETVYRPQLEKQAKQLAAKDQEVEQAFAKSDRLVNAYGALMSIQSEEEAVAKFRQDWHNFPQAQLAARERDLAEREQRLNAPRSDVSDVAPVVIEDVADWARARAGKWLEDAASGMPWLTSEARTDLAPVMTDPDRLWKLGVLRYATEQDVEQSWLQRRENVTLGQFYLDREDLYAVLKEQFATPYVKAQAAAQQAKQQLQTLGTVATTNRRILEKGTPPVSAKTKAPPSKPAKPVTAEDQREQAEAKFAARRAEVARDLATGRFR